MVSGDFAVKKNATETRVITDVITNQLLDEDLWPRSSFDHVPRLRVYTVPRRCLLINKVDARHYFHVLAVGGR